MPSGVYERTEEHCRHISEALSGLPKEPFTEEHCRNMSGSALEAWKRRREAGTVTCPHTEESNRQRSETLSGYRQTEEHRRHTSGSLLEQWKDPEIRDRRLEGQGKYWASISQEEKKERLENSFHSETAKENFRIYCETHTGENHPNWKGGSGDYRNGWRDITYFIQVRDRWTCQLCSTREDLCIHHIDYDTFNWSDDNLITLCRRCNSVVNLDREYWTSYFGNLLREKILLKTEKERCLLK